jgi:hypothetical protein
VSFASTLLGTAAAVTLVVASAARPVSASDCAIHGTCCFVRAAAPVVRLESSPLAIEFDRISVGDTGLDRSSVRRALRRDATRLERCFTRASKVDVVFVIAPSGAASLITVTGGDRAVATCVASGLARIGFPAAGDLSLTEAHVTITAQVTARSSA